MGYERKGIAQMHGYVPGKQPANAQTIKLNTNENPYPPSPAVMQVLTAVEPDWLRRYPEPMAEAFRAQAARVHGVRAEEIVATNGGDELLRMAITTFVEPGAPIGVLEPSYSLYPVLAEIHGSPVVRVNAHADFGTPSDFAARMNDAGVSLSLLVNPHAPSGKLTGRDEIAKIARELKGVLLVDEAYIDFVDPRLGHDLLPLIHEHDNLLFLRTLSKGYSLAGLRFGYGIGAESLIAPLLGKTRDSYNVDAIAQRLATAALADRAYAQDTWLRVREERKRVRDALLELRFEVPESQSNFLLAKLPAHRLNAPALQQELEARGVLVRYFAQDRLEQSLRITIGTPEQNDKLLGLLRVLLA
ncbi:MAG TPA: histidinol-phosphate transaminase [Polyangiales bacterium]|jgi:histidinol-phosphate aminotransferase|nr:histidinol-phosphate transaminase [Polyangiales bacterium]